MKICVVPDTQVKPDVPLDHLLYAGKYIAEKKPDAIVLIGDWWDMESLCSYDKGKTSFEGRRYNKDIEAGNLAMDLFLQPIKAEINRLKVNKKKQWKPRLVFTMGNHEYRIERAIEYDSILEDTIGYFDLNLNDFEVYDYLQPVVIEGVAFSHFFTTGVMGRPVTSARALLTKKMMSCVMGHVQDRDIAYGKRADNVRLTGLFAGMFTQHNEAYLGNQGNDSWKGIWMLNEVNNGSFDELPVSLTYLKRKYGD
jgi:hypothetical protein|tara:strand:- start:513 stop:1271 length:759 start_codon:yes stop_codon:yes gene_type:complete